jgi:hypothetical protein
MKFEEADVDVGPNPLRSARRKWWHKGEPWAVGLRWAAVFFTVLGLGGMLLVYSAAVFMLDGAEMQDLRLGRLPGGFSRWALIGIFGNVFAGSFAVGLVLTLVSFLGTTISFFLGNRSAFGGEDILLLIGWYGSGVVMFAIVGFVTLAFLVGSRLRPGLARHLVPGANVPAPVGPGNRLAPNAIPPPPVAAEEPINPEAQAGVIITQALADLKSPEPFRRRAALARLKAAPPVDDRRAEVAGAVEPVLRDPDPGCRSDAAKTLGFWGGKENTPALVKTLQDSTVWVRWAALDALAELRDPAAAEAVAARLPEERAKAGAALRAMGPGAEPAVLKYLGHSDVFVRAEACKVLEEIGGSEECKAALLALIRRTNNFGLDAGAARSALSKLGMPSPASRKKSIVPGVKRG